MIAHRNELLRALFEAGARSQLEPLLHSVNLERGSELAGPETPFRQIYFPDSGVVSYSILLKDGHSVQTGTVGHDGAVGTLQALDRSKSPALIQVQIAGRASAIDISHFAAVVRDNPLLRGLIIRSQHYFISELQVTAACNAIHSIEQRLCRWLLRMNDLVGVTVPMTQETLAQMLGVRRTSVSLAASSLQNRGIIKYRRGSLTISDIEALRGVACECYELLRQHRADLRLPEEAPDSERRNGSLTC